MPFVKVSNKVFLLKEKVNLRLCHIICSAAMLSPPYNHLMQFRDPLQILPLILNKFKRINELLF